jgi:deazaflavin-dependent oxidoreductase (nitroreductase family)
VRVAVTRGPVARLSARFLPSLDRASVRLTGGRVVLSAWVTGLPIIELGTTGARSGQPRTHRVMGIPEPDGHLVVGANFGGPSDPAWCHNLRAHPRATVGHTAYGVAELAGVEREAAFARALELNPGWRRFQDRAGRPLPVFRLTRA